MARDHGGDPVNPADLVARAMKGAEHYLRGLQGPEDALRTQLDALERNLTDWLEDAEIDRLSPQLKRGIALAIDRGDWGDLVSAFGRKLNFGTGGIRGLMGFDKASIELLIPDHIDAPILKGPNTINNLVVLQAAYGVASYFKEVTPAEKGPVRAVVGHDTRVLGASFAQAIAETFLSLGLEVYLFDEAIPYPEVTFAIPHLKCDFGVFISASHNDYRYNGFKMSAASGAQIRSDARDVIIEKIRATTFAQIKPVSLAGAGSDVLARLHFLGGREPLPNRPYFGRESDLIDVHSALIAQIKTFLLRKEIFSADGGAARDLGIIYSAFNGAGRVIVPRILQELGFQRVHRIGSLDAANGLFPAFKSAPGEEQQPDPGDPRAGSVAMRELKADEVAGRDAVGNAAIRWKDADLVIGTDPDADRCGVVVKPPRDLADVIRDRPSLRYTPERVLIPADDMWALLLWYRLQHEMETHGRIRDAEASFIAMSHTTSDVIGRLVAKHGIGVLKTWVGFGWLSAGVSEAWKGGRLPAIREGREQSKVYGPKDTCNRVFYDTTGMKKGQTFNLAALEQSNGFSILGGPPRDPDRELGVGGHVRDKDGTFAAVLVAEIAAYARQRGTDILSLLADHIFCDPEIGIFANYYEPDPLDGEFPGVEGDRKKAAILARAMALADEGRNGSLVMGGRKVTACSVYWTGKYDKENGNKLFPDEGIRFFLGSALDYVTIRPSGTTNSLRFHVQLWRDATERGKVWSERILLEAEARKLVDEVRVRLDAPRQVGAEF